MKVLIADKFPESAQTVLAKLGHDVTFSPDTSADSLPETIGDHDALIVRSTKVTTAALDAAKNLQLIVRAGAGVNTIDVAGASKLGIYVTNCPGKNAVAVAELTMGLMLGLDRRIPAGRADLLSGQWNKKEFSKADGVRGKTYGVIGLGPIGREVVERARAFGLKLVAWSRSLTDEDAAALSVSRATSVLDLAAKCDIVSVHLPFNDDTKKLLGKEFFGTLPEGAMVINTSRGGIVDEAALLEAMNTRGIRYATDVFDNEPGSGQAEFDHPLAKDPRVVCTPHIGASTEEAQTAVAQEAVRVIRDYATSGTIHNCVNLRRRSPATHVMSIRHEDKVGVLASALAAIRKANINVQEVQNVIFDGAPTACAKLHLASAPPADLAQQVAALENVIDARVVEVA